MQGVCEMKNKPFIKSPPLLDLHYLVAFLVLVSVVGLVGNMIWKISLMRSEQALLRAGEEAAV